MTPSSAFLPFGHQPPQGRPRSRAASSAALSTPVWPPDRIAIFKHHPSSPADPSYNMVPSSFDTQIKRLGEILFSPSPTSTNQQLEFAGNP